VDLTKKNKHYPIVLGKILASETGGKIKIIILDQQVINELVFLV